MRRIARTQSACSSEILVHRRQQAAGFETSDV
jgi:hypothetical protein